MSLIPAVTRRQFLAAASTALGGVVVHGESMFPQRTLRVGVIGLGVRGQQHVRTLLAMPGVSLTAVADVVSARLAECKQLTHARGCPQFVHSGRELLALSTVDALTIATTDEHHVNLALAAAREGKHVFVESPSATSFKQVAALKTASNRQLVLADGIHGDHPALSSPIPHGTSSPGQLRRAELFGAFDTAAAMCGATLHSHSLLEQVDAARSALGGALPCRVEATAFRAADGNLIRLRGNLELRTAAGDSVAIALNLGPEFARLGGIRLTGTRGSRWLTLPLPRPSGEPHVPGLYGFVADIWTDPLHRIQRRLSIPIERGAVSAVLVQALAVAATLRRPLDLDVDGHARGDSEADAFLWSVDSSHDGLRRR
jgi:hypothetical protein